ncbi:MAG: hypothetical protein ACI9R3_004984 [Verrucomicrobiales bacterium]|jgi:hypothetical protein
MDNVDTEILFVVTLVRRFEHPVFISQNPCPRMIAGHPQTSAVGMGFLVTALILFLGKSVGCGEELQKPQSAVINTLTISKQGKAEFSGHRSLMQLTATALEDPNAETHFERVKGNGKTLRRSLHAVKQFFATQQRWQNGIRLTLKFEDASHPHDGDSFSMGAALLLDAIMTGTPVDDQVYVTGRLAPDGRIRRVGGIRKKIDAASEAKPICPVVLIPSANMESISDIIVLEGPEILSQVQIIGVDCFEQAQRITTSQRTEEVQQAVRLFQRIANVVRNHSSTPEELDKTLANKRLQNALAKILTVIPNHLSAHYLNLRATHKQPTRLSPNGSLRAIDHVWPRLLANTGDSPNQIEARRSAILELDQLAPLLDDCSNDYAAAVRHYADLSTALEETGVNEQSKRQHLRKAGSHIDTEKRYLQQKLDAPHAP